MPVTQAAAKGVLQEYAGLSESQADELVKAVVSGAEREALELLGGQEPVPSTVMDARALRLRFICENLGRLLKPREVEVVLRLPANTAQNVIKRMNSTYPQAVDKFLRADVAGTATVQETGNATDGFRYEIFFDELSALDYAYQLLQRHGLTHDVKVRRAGQTLDLPREIDRVNVLEVLGLSAP